MNHYEKPPQTRASSEKLLRISKVTRRSVWIFAAGLLVGWMVFGWLLFPVKYTQVYPDELQPQVMNDYIIMTAESYATTHDLRTAAKRLRYWDKPGQLGTMIQQLAQSIETKNPEDAAYLRLLFQDLNLSVTPGASLPRNETKSRTRFDFKWLLAPLFVLTVFAGLIWLAQRLGLLGESVVYVPEETAPHHATAQDAMPLDASYREPDDGISDSWEGGLDHDSGASVLGGLEDATFEDDFPLDQSLHAPWQHDESVASDEAHHPNFEDEDALTPVSESDSDLDSELVYEPGPADVTEEPGPGDDDSLVYEPDLDDVEDLDDEIVASDADSEAVLSEEARESEPTVSDEDALAEETVDADGIEQVDAAHSEKAEMKLGHDDEPKIEAVSSSSDDVMVSRTVRFDGDPSYNLIIPIEKDDDYLGEIGFGADQTAQDNPNLVLTLEVWLFDKSDTQTRNAVLAPPVIAADPDLIADYTDGDALVIPLQEGKTIQMETAELRLRGEVKRVKYGAMTRDDIPVIEYAEIAFTGQRK